jgi:hypothetical protein
MLEPGCRTGCANMQVLVRVVMAAAVAGAGGCLPDVGSDPTPTAMELDLTATPPRAPQPTALIVNPQTGLIDFSLAGTPIPDDCSTQQALTEAQCQFNQWLQTLNGFPTVTPASAPASSPLDPATLTLGENVIAVAAKQGGVVTDVTVGFDTASSSLTLTPLHGWTLGELYWVGVRGYANGVRDAGGGQVVGSPTMALLKQDAPLTCGAADPTTVDPHCPAFEVVAQGSPSAEAAAAQLFQLEAIRTAFIAGHGFDVMAAAGLPKEDIAVLWGFPIHTNSVPVLVPSAGAVPRVLAADQIVVGVQGPVDPATVSAFTAGGQPGPVVVVDLTALDAGDLAAAFPRVTATYVAASSAIAIQASQPFPAGHQIGLFFTNAIHSPDTTPLVASPVSVLLTLTAPLVDGAGHSTVAGVTDADAAALEAGRGALSALFDSAIFTPMTGVSRANVIYAYAFIPMVQP